MRSGNRSLCLLAGAGLLVASCGAAATPTPAPTPIPTVAPTPRPTPMPVDDTDGEGDEAVVGTQMAYVSTPYTMERVGDVLQYRRGVVTTTDTTNDVRATGKGTYSFSVDSGPALVGPEWGTYRLENDGGTWEGPCTGGSLEDATSIMTCWLVGGGGYAGYTYYHFRDADRLEGIIYKGSPPSAPTP